MATQVVDIQKEDLDKIIKETEGVLDELGEMLSTVEVKVTSKSPDVIKAISSLFGASKIRSDGSAIITYKMYKEVNKMLRVAGSAKVGSYL